MSGQPPGLAAPTRKLGAVGIDGDEPTSSCGVVRGPRALRRRAVRSGPAHIVYERCLNVVLLRVRFSHRDGRRAARRGRDLPRAVLLQASLRRGFGGQVRPVRRARFVKLRAEGDFSTLEFQHFFRTSATRFLAALWGAADQGVPQRTLRRPCVGLARDCGSNGAPARAGSTHTPCVWKSPGLVSRGLICP